MGPLLGSKLTFPLECMAWTPFWVSVCECDAEQLGESVRSAGQQTHAL